MYDFKAVEDDVIALWKKRRILEKVRKASELQKRKFYFMDGPPYATGHIHMGTALNKILKDIVMRSKRMQGMNVFDRPGYDTHGVPIEYQVEKEIGVKSKQDIEDYGVKKFISRCREFATQYIDVMNDEFMNLGVWMDWKNPYLTLSNEYIESIWWTLKQADKKKLLYLGKYPVHVCPRCETAVAYNEIEHAMQEDKAIFVKFPVEGEPGKFFIIWTTTPWTLPGNAAVMVHPDIEYAEIELQNGETWILAKDLIEKLMNKFCLSYEIKKTFHGKELENKKYRNPLAHYIKVQLKNAYKVILSGRYVNLDVGTGLVHCAPGHGKEDHDASRKYSIDMLCPVKINGIFIEEAGKYSGKKAREVDAEIIQDLESDKHLVFSEFYLHEYPLCWRCKTPLLMLAVPQWFFKIKDIHAKLLRENERVQWTPSWARERMKAWLEGISDWPISRQRYWGTPLPIWRCGVCESYKVIGSMQELERFSKMEIKDLHKPYIDRATIPCDCGNIMKRVPEVLDVWFDSGVASWAALGFPQNERLFKKFWPADLNLEGTDQFRGWWNGEIILSQIAFDKKPFDSIYMHGMVLDISKRKMSKSLGNIISPAQVIEKYGRDAMRWYLSLIQPGENLAYDESYFKEIDKFFTIFINIKNLITNDFGLRFSEQCIGKAIEDQWILSRLQHVTMECLDNYNKYQFYKVSELLTEFVIQDLSRTYIQMVRERISNEDKHVGIVLNTVLSNVMLLAAPIIPYLTELIYQEMKGKKESVHLCLFSKKYDKKINVRLEYQFYAVLRIIEAGLRERDKIKIGLKWPLAKAMVKADVHLTEPLKELIKRQLNVKEILLQNTKENVAFSITYDTTYAPELEAEGYARELTRKIQSMRKNAGLEKKDKIILEIVGDKAILSLLKPWKKFLKGRVHAKTLFFSDVITAKYKNSEQLLIKEKRFDLAFNSTA